MKKRTPMGLPSRLLHPIYVKYPRSIAPPFSGIYGCFCLLCSHYFYHCHDMLSIAIVICDDAILLQQFAFDFIGTIFPVIRIFVLLFLFHSFRYTISCTFIFYFLIYPQHIVYLCPIFRTIIPFVYFYHIHIHIVYHYIITLVYYPLVSIFMCPTVALLCIGILYNNSHIILFIINIYYILCMFITHSYYIQCICFG